MNAWDYHRKSVLELNEAHGLDLTSGGLLPHVVLTTVLLKKVGRRQKLQLAGTAVGIVGQFYQKAAHRSCTTAL